MSDDAGRTAWGAVDAYIAEKLFPADAALDAALEANAAAGLPAIDVSPAQGRLLELLARMAGAARILEIGTLGGYSTICFARALPADGRIVTCEIDAKHAEVAMANIARAGLTERVELRLGPALDTLKALHQERAAPFDLVFIDADKPSNTDYFEGALKLSRPGTTIIVDNVVRDGAVADPQTSNHDAKGVRRLFDDLATRTRVAATAIQTVGAKGWDGFVLAVVQPDATP